MEMSVLVLETGSRDEELTRAKPSINYDLCPTITHGQILVAEQFPTADADGMNPAAQVRICPFGDTPGGGWPSSDIFELKCRRVAPPGREVRVGDDPIMPGWRRHTPIQRRRVHHDHASDDALGAERKRRPRAEPMRIHFQHEQRPENFMIERVLIAAGLLLLAACQPAPGASTTSPSATASSAPCNRVAPNRMVAAMMRGDATPASAMPALRGGVIAPGLYDLASGEQLDGAPSWEDTRYVSLKVSASVQGSVLDWAQFSGPNSTTRTDWTGLLRAGPPATLVFTCGRAGTAPISFAIDEGEVHMRLPDPSGAGVLDLVFAPHQA